MSSEDTHILRTRLAAVEAERDEADRRAGAAQRRLADLEDTDRKARWWMEDQKMARGYDRGVSFDTVWSETCAKADAALARAERAEKALKEIALQDRGGLQGLEEDACSEADAVAYLISQIERRRKIARAALSSVAEEA